MSFYLVFRNRFTQDEVKVGPLNSMRIERDAIVDTYESEEVAYFSPSRGEWAPINLGMYWSNESYARGFDTVEVTCTCNGER